MFCTTDSSESELSDCEEAAYNSELLLLKLINFNNIYFKNINLKYNSLKSIIIDNNFNCLKIF